jgi:hypothetical protein
MWREAAVVLRTTAASFCKSRSIVIAGFDAGSKERSAMTMRKHHVEVFGEREDFFNLLLLFG